MHRIYFKPKTLLLGPSPSPYCLKNTINSLRGEAG
jgi:hypothetical protein